MKKNQKQKGVEGKNSISKSESYIELKTKLKIKQTQFMGETEKEGKEETEDE